MIETLEGETLYDVVNAFTRVAQRFPGTVDVVRVTAGQAANDRSFDLASNRLHCFEVAGRGNGEAGLDNVHAEVLERMRHFQLLGKVHAGPGGLLAVPQRGIENDQAVVLRHGQAPLETVGKIKKPWDFECPRAEFRYAGIL